MVAPSPASSMVLETRGKGRERGEHWMWGAECQSHWKQLLILVLLWQPHEYWPQGWQGPGAGEEAAIRLPAGWHRTAKPCPFTCQCCARSWGLPARQAGKGLCSKALYCLQVMMSFSARGTMLILPLGWFIILEFFWCWFFELLTDSYIGSLILRSIDVKGCCLCLYLSTLSAELLVVVAKLIIFLMGDLICSQSWQKSPFCLSVNIFWAYFL